MINKKFASAVGLGATAIGAAGSTMTSANLFDLLKNDKKAQDEYLKETKKVRNRAVAKNIIKKMLSDLDGGSNDKSDLIERLKDAIDPKKNVDGASEKIDETEVVTAGMYDMPTNLLEEKLIKIDKNKTFKKKQKHNNSNNNNNINNIDNYEGYENNIINDNENNIINDNENNIINTNNYGGNENNIINTSNKVKGNEKISLKEYEDRFSIIDSCLKSISDNKKITNEQLNKLVKNDNNFENLLGEKGIIKDNLVLSDNAINNNAIPVGNKEIIIKFMKEYLKKQEEELIDKLYNRNNDVGDILNIIFGRAEKNDISEKQVIKFLIENTMVKVIEDKKEETKIFRKTKTFKDLFVPQNEVAERKSIIDYARICMASDYCCKLLSEGKKLSTVQFEAVKRSYDDDQIYSLFKEGLRGNDLVINGISDLYNDNHERLTIEYLKDKEKNAIKDFYEKTCFGRVIFLNELNYDIKLSSTLTKIAVEGIKYTVSQVAFPIAILGWIADRFTAFGTKFAENKINKLHDKLQPQLGDSDLPSGLDTIKETHESLF